MGRFDILHEIERLDPVRDHQRIVHLSFGYEFPWDSVRSLEIASPTGAAVTALGPAFVTTMV